MRLLNSPVLFKVLGSTIVLLPFIFLLFFLEKNSVNTPFWDQWELVSIYENVNNGQYVFNDFWQQHNEHRLLFPRILMVALAVITDWNTRAEILTNALLALASFGLLLFSLKLLFKKYTKTLGVSTLFILSLIWFSPLQHENWLWGWQLQWFLNVLGVMLVVYGLSRIISYGFKSINLIIIAVGAILAEFSLGNGILIWPLAILALLYLGVKGRKRAVSILVSLVMMAIYYIGYESTGGPSKSLVLKEPLLFFEYLFSYIGRPITGVEHAAPVFGFLLASTFMSLSIYTFYRRKQDFRMLLPVIVLGMYSLASAGITSLSRMGYGAETALTSRYTTISSLLLVSTFIMAIYCISRMKLSASIKKSGLVSLLACTGLLVLINAYQILDQAEDRSQYRRDIQSCTQVDEPTRICLLSTYPDEEKVAPLLNYLKEKNWSGY